MNACPYIHTYPFLLTYPYIHIHTYISMHTYPYIPIHPSIHIYIQYHTISYGIIQHHTCTYVYHIIFKGFRLTAGCRPSKLGTMLATTLGVWCGKIGPRFSAQTQEGLCWTEAGIMRSACLYGSSLGLRWAQVVPMLVAPSWAYLGLILVQVRPMLSHRAHLGPMFGQVGRMLSYVGPMLGLCWAYVGLCWPMLGLCWPMLSLLGSYVGAMFGPAMLKRS